MEAKLLPFVMEDYLHYITYVASTNTKKKFLATIFTQIGRELHGKSIVWEELSHINLTLQSKKKVVSHQLLRMWWGERVRTWQDPQTLLSQDLLQEFNTLQLYTTSEPHHLCDDHWWSPKKTQKKTKSSDPFIYKY